MAEQKKNEKLTTYGGSNNEQLTTYGGKKKNENLRLILTKNKTYNLWGTLIHYGVTQIKYKEMIKELQKKQD